MKKIGLSERGQYNTKDTFITLALSAGEDPGWIAHLCGTSEQMIYRHYRSWMPSVRRDDGKRLAAILKIGPEIGPKGTRWSPGVYKIEKLERAGKSNVDWRSSEGRKSRLPRRFCRAGLP